jgi:hypothetical protein
VIRVDRHDVKGAAHENLLRCSAERSRPILVGLTVANIKPENTFTSHAWQRSTPTLSSNSRNIPNSVLGPLVNKQVIG